MDGDGADVVDGDDDKLDDVFVYNFDTYSFGVVRPSVESGLGHVNDND